MHKCRANSLSSPSLLSASFRSFRLSRCLYPTFLLPSTGKSSLSEASRGASVPRSLPSCKEAPSDNGNSRPYFHREKKYREKHRRTSSCSLGNSPKYGSFRHSRHIVFPWGFPGKPFPKVRYTSSPSPHDKAWDQSKGAE